MVPLRNRSVREVVHLLVFPTHNRQCVCQGLLCASANRMGMASQETAAGHGVSWPRESLLAVCLGAPRVPCFCRPWFLRRSPFARSAHAVIPNLVGVESGDNPLKQSANTCGICNSCRDQPLTPSALWDHVPPPFLRSTPNDSAFGSCGRNGGLWDGHLVFVACVHAARSHGSNSQRVVSDYSSVRRSTPHRRIRPLGSMFRKSGVSVHATRKTREHVGSHLIDTKACLNVCEIWEKRDGAKASPAGLLLRNTRSGFWFWGKPSQP